MNRNIFFSELSSKLWKIVRFIILIGLSYVLLYPIMYMITLAVRTPTQMNDPSVIWIPKVYTMDNFVKAYETMNYTTSFLSTILLSFVCAFFQLISCSMVGYGFARFKFKSSGLWFAIVILTLIVPTYTITIPLYMQYLNFSIPIISPILEFGFGYTISGVNLIDSWLVFWIPALLGVGIRSGLYIYIFRQFFRGIPNEIEEAAVVDGAGFFKTFYSIMMPNAGGAYLTVFLFSIVWYWNDTYNTNMFIMKKRTLAKALSSLGADLGANNANTAMTSTVGKAGCLLFILPLLLMYMFLQKYFVQSIERTGIVG